MRLLLLALYLEKPLIHKVVRSLERNGVRLLPLAFYLVYVTFPPI
ncbi:hypothetical protein [Scytonema hofmannii]|nr:hypothetical protein [Scytonema hofmannii]